MEEPQRTTQPPKLGNNSLPNYKRFPRTEGGANGILNTYRAWKYAAGATWGPKVLENWPGLHETANAYRASEEMKGGMTFAEYLRIVEDFHMRGMCLQT